MVEDENSWNPKGGRPKKQVRDLKAKRLNLCFTEEEFNALKAEMQAAGYNILGVYAKSKLLSRQGAVPHNPKQLFNVLDKLSPELKRIGVNINQIARYVNYLDSNNMIKADFIAEYNANFKKMAEVQHEYAVAIRAYLRSLVRKDNV